ncbi:hypothetical protein AN639_11605 [Candidatus Epulonipiscium fishelsonii]|uniref:Uncharacterized protein n=1 Tax=Candidatus Epulonipiscium fishelsonii TaxID=77094 RepID=A0ACC8XFZ7_9FIRM|nr:hypothetical protein AN396_01710 [Epulopiscium sp. SCG-B11WGA-EpuloA1]ONI42957.1 hypothetical protein AN639_11605 [Epulopiscium sp. SCG-B05WGA-EpuloA1]
MERKIRVQGIQSDWFEDAVFTVKEENLKDVPYNLCNYAEELIERHMKLKGYSEGFIKTSWKNKTVEKKIDLFFKLSLLFLMITVIMYMYGM